MAFEVTFNLQDSDLTYFREVMQKAQANAKHLSDATILANAKKLSAEVTDAVPSYVQQRLQKLEAMVAMVEDEEWQIPAQERSDVLAALAYFSEAEDLVPDHIPVLGFLDDAIMIELVAESLTENIEAYADFCAYRERELTRAGEDGVSKQDWLADKRRELHERMRKRRASKSGRSGSFRSIF